MNILRKTVFFVSRSSLSFQSSIALRIFAAVSLELFVGGEILLLHCKKKNMTCERRTSNVCECSQYFSEFWGITN